MGLFIRTVPSTAILLTIIAFLPLLGCDPPNKQAGVLDPEKAAQKTVETKQGINPSSRLSEADQILALASINNEVITLGEFERRLNDQPPFARTRYNTKESKQQFLNDIIQFEVLADEAEKKGYGSHPDVVLNLKQAMVRKMMAAHIDKTVSLGDITEDEINAYYKAHISDYIKPEKIRTSQIVLADEETANKVVEALKAEFEKDPTHKRKIFQRKAREVSIDKATAEKGGDMRFYTRPEDGGTVPKEICDVAFAMKNVEEMVGPIKTEQGWRLLMLMGRKQRYERAFEEVKRSIANRLYREKRVIAEQDYVAQAKKQATIELNAKILEKIPDAKPSDTPSKGHGH